LWVFSIVEVDRARKEGPKSRSANGKIFKIAG